MAAKTPVSANASWKINPAEASQITFTAGDPVTGADEIAIWAAASVNLNKRQSNVGVIRNLQRFLHDNFTLVDGVATPDIIHGNAISGSSGSDAELNGTPTADQLRIEIGANYVGNSHMIDVAITQLLQAMLEATTGN